MPRPIHKDSWSRCETPSMLYDVVKNPRNLQQPVVQKTRDVIEAPPKLHREFLDRLRSGNINLSHDSYVVVAQVGKYLFLAIMLPPYLCLYGIPKWMIADLLPRFMILVKSEVLKIGRFFQKISAKITDLMKGAMEQLIGQSLRLFRGPSQSLLRGLELGMGFFAQSMKRLKKLSSRIPPIKVPLLQVLLTRTSKFWARLRPIVQTLKEDTLYWEKRIERFSSKCLEACRRQLSPIHEWLKPKLDSALELGRTYGKWVKKQAVELSKKTKKYLEGVKSYLPNPYPVLASWVSEILPQMFNTLASWIAPKLEFSRQKISRARSFTSKISKKMSPLFRILIRPLMNATDSGRQQAHQFLKKFGPFLKERLPKIQLRDHINKKFDFSKRLLSKWSTRVVLKIKGLLHFGQKGFQTLKRFASIFWILVRDSAKKTPRRLLGILVKGSRSSYVIFKKFLKGFRLGLAFSIALFCYFMILLKELVVEMDSWMTLNARESGPLHKK